MISFLVNEQKISIESPQKKIFLLDYLRNTLNLTGTKRGCQEAGCGACTVLINGEAKRSCSIDISRLDGKRIVTIEGLAQDRKLDPIQEAFIACSAVQCGFCTPGMIMSAKALLLKNDNPGDDDIKKALKINLCRCGTYPRVLDAVKRSAAAIRGETLAPYTAETVGEYTVIGKSVPRIDTRDKVTGNTKFYADYTFENMLYGKIVWSKYPHAEIISIDTESAESMPGVQLVLTAKDIPGKNAYGVFLKDQPVIAKDKVRHIGDPVAVVFADDEETAQAGADAVVVKYHPLPGIFTIEAALAPDAPLIHDKETLSSGFYDNLKSMTCQGNVYYQYSLKRGNAEAAFAEADVILKEEYLTPYQEHAFIETEGCITRLGDDGKVVVYAPSQIPFGDRAELSEVLNLAAEDIIFIHTPAGGAFGTKCDLTIHALAAIASMKTGRPARIVLSREESFRYHPKRHKFFMKYRIAAKKDGKILGMDINLTADGGAYTSWNVMRAALAFSTGPYYVPNFNIHGLCVYTNNLIGGAFRGYGVPQVTFAVESLLDELSAKLNIDPVTLREINAVDVGVPIATGEILRTGAVGFKQTLTAIRKALREELEPLKKGSKNVGIGIASGYRFIADGLGIQINTGAALELENDGRITLKIEAGELGQGTQTSLCQIISEFFGVRIYDINVIGGDTSKVPYGEGLQGSQGLFLNGLAVIKASKKLRGVLLEKAAIILNVSQDSLSIADGTIVNKENCSKKLTFADLASSNAGKLCVEEHIELPETYNLTEDTNEGGAINPKHYRNYQALSYITAAIAVSVDDETGIVNVLHAVIAIDSGKIINPEAARTQVEGALIQGMGYGLTEDFVIENGIIVTNTLGKIRLPRIDLTPDKITTIFVEIEDPTGPFGAKGLGEIPFLPIAPALTNAIKDATGIRLTKLPARKYLSEHLPSKA